MKYFILFLLALSLLNVNTFAAQNLIAGVEEVYADPYTELETLYNKGSLPSTKDYLGMFTGRTFSSYDKSTAINALFIGRIVETGDDNGPLFPSAKEYRAKTVFMPSGSANYFDVLTENLLIDIENFISENGLSSVSFTNDTLIIDIDGITQSCRTHGNYLICKVTIADEINSFSYFFKKVD